ncbi:hypothetical protein P153DRAFT_364274 [Dothidotthia symphoricarpi CBS 119687]|uniref:C3H1-type domain-containing protein n=1 Tax=Dothidotthia symphoricarpi CBS 119687 TaxID=1392245 RepID=A0A6A6AMN6_9PLEO|nr:uncharacterized protein P153DRAFT_364274 [Dothidotthia symphoricarpi CBS 119687]KAF2133050.1 hypothetical protein P153DRAFT_364274 [Dothidotthia symphoricarpi CBS 119687]
MTSFKFPPPPPPPPKALPTNNPQPYPSQRGGNARGGSDRGGGDRGRGRGRGGDNSNGFTEGSRGGRGRGGSNNTFNANARGGYGQGDGRGNARGRGGSRGGHQNNRGGGHLRGGSNPGYGQQQQPQSPPQTNTPLFANQPQPTIPAQAPVDPNAFAQAMAFMTTPAGVQSMAAFANHMSHPVAATPQYTQPEARYSPPQQAGQKRKLNDYGDNAQLQRKPPQPKPPRAKAAVAPPVPSFGFSLPTPVFASHPAASKSNDKQQNKRKLHLGLSHHPMPDESSEEEDVDEEAVFSNKVKFEGVAFEHNGETISLQTPAEVAAWRKDRKRNFPTEKRAVEKAEETAAKRESELEFLHRIKGKPPKQKEMQHERPTQDNHAKPNKKTNKNNNNKSQETNPHESARKQEELAALRKKLHQSMLAKQSLQSTPRPVDLSLGYTSETDSDGKSSVLSDSSVLSPSDESSSDEDSASDSDAAPVQQSTKLAPPPINVPPPLPAPRPERAAPEKRVCVQWKRYGKCAYGHSCRFVHPQRESEKRVGLYEKMVEQERVKADGLALEAIKYLGRHGFLG